MLNAEYFNTIYRRKSFHLFRNVGNESISDAELSDIQSAWQRFPPLYPEIRTAIRIVPSSKIGFRRDAEYCILIYSEKKENDLMNAGYLGEQLDLYLTARQIGTLWYGIGKPDEPVYEGLDFVIMIAVHKVSDPSLFRKDMTKAKRKPVGEIWSGNTLGIADIVRFAPSACNSQPWRVTNENGVLSVSRYRKQTRIGIMSPAAAFYFNRIDIGIFLCFLEICMAEKGLFAERTLYPDLTDTELVRIAEYRLSNGSCNRTQRKNAKFCSLRLVDFDANKHYNIHTNQIYGGFYEYC